jgi:hypothetical protein
MQKHAVRKNTEVRMMPNIVFDNLLNLEQLSLYCNPSVPYR